MILRFVVETGTFTSDSTVSWPTLGVHMTPYFMGNMVYLEGGFSVRSVKLNTHFCVAENLRTPPLTHRFKLQEASLNRMDKFSFFFYLCLSV